ncbi:peptidoglycan-binding protein, partial [Candidatus Bathyarchaeota archaeon]|nr:peptidoglycan-binding protein [Candidatus Bathyarchaeota archaeon]
IFKGEAKVEWKEKKPSEWKRYLPIRNQSTSGSCVAFAIALGLGTENLIEENKFEVLSARFIYSRGYVPETGGMYYLNALEIARKEGTCLEQQMPSDGKNEAEMRVKDDTANMRWVAQIYKANSYVFLPLNFDRWAQFLAENPNKVILTGLRFNPGGFSSGEVVLDRNGVYGHAVNIVDYTLWKGQKALVFQHAWTDKWGFGGLGIITEEQFYRGVILGAYLIDFKYEPSTKPKPVLVIYANTLKVGDRNRDVVKLQVGLQWLGYFPADVECTGYYGGITRQAVREFQKAYNLNVTGIADFNTIKKFNEIFAQ